MNSERSQTYSKWSVKKHWISTLSVSSFSLELELDVSEETIHVANSRYTLLSRVFKTVHIACRYSQCVEYLSLLVLNRTSTYNHGIMLWDSHKNKYARADLK